MIISNLKSLQLVGDFHGYQSQKLKKNTILTMIKLRPSIQYKG